MHAWIVGKIVCEEKDWMPEPHLYFQEEFLGISSPPGLLIQPSQVERRVYLEAHGQTVKTGILCERNIGVLWLGLGLRVLGMLRRHMHPDQSRSPLAMPKVYKSISTPATFSKP